MSAQADAEAQLREAVAVGEELQGHLQGIEEQLAYLRALSQEFQRSRATLEALQEAKAGDELLLPIGGGAFVRAKLAEAGKVLHGLGAGYSAEGTLPEAIRRVDEQLEMARQAQQRLQEEGAKVVQQLQVVEDRVQQLAG